MAARRLAPCAVALSLAAVLTLTLGACQGASTDEAPAEAAADLDTPTAGDAGAPTPGPIIETGADVSGLANLAPVPPEPPEPLIDDDPQQLYGLTPAALDALLGRPSLIRREDPAQIWQYRSQTCVFDVFLYEEADGPRVSYIEARDDAAQQIAARACLNELLRVRLGLPLG